MKAPEEVKTDANMPMPVLGGGVLRRALRSEIFSRDHGVCAGCGMDTEALRLRQVALMEQGVPKEILNRVLEEHGFHDAASSSLWHADHTVPLWAGGADDSANVRSLCQACHFAKTKEEAGDRGKRRRMTPSRSKCGDSHEWIRRGQLKLTRTLRGETVAKCWNCRERKPID